MNDLVAQQLLALNRKFYNTFAASFDDSRRTPQPGFEETLTHLPKPPLNVLDVGCGNGRYGRFLGESGRLGRYIGVDFSIGLLGHANDLEKLSRWSPKGQVVEIAFQEADMSQVGFLNGHGVFDLVVCLSAMQHIPQRIRRAQLLHEMGRHLSENGRLLLGNWQFLASERQRRKVLSWEEADLTDGDVEKGDYLLSWNRGGYGERYVCLIDEAETDYLADMAGLEIVHQFRADGREGNLNLYTVFQKR